MNRNRHLDKRMDERDRMAFGLLPRLTAQLRVSAAAFFALAVMSVAGCRSKAVETDVRSDVLLSVGDSVLTMHDVMTRIPEGMDPADSAEMFRSVVDTWLEDLLLEDLARNTLTDMERIDRMVADYRRRLIVMSYMQKARENRASKISGESIRRYYDRHKEELVLEVPLVKGVFLKYPENSLQLGRVRSLMTDGSPECIDSLETEGLGEALQYDYFGDRWIDWSSVAEQIPYRFFDAEAFLQAQDYFETEYNGAVYMLRVYGHIPSGEIMPFEFAGQRIERILEGRDAAAVERALVVSLCRKAIEEGRLVTYGYDPLGENVTVRPEVSP